MVCMWGTAICDNQFDETISHSRNAFISSITYEDENGVLESLVVTTSLALFFLVKTSLA